MAIVANTAPNMLPDICQRLAERMVAQFNSFQPGRELSKDEKNTIRNAYRLLVMYEANHLDARRPTGVLGAMSDSEADVEQDASGTSQRFRLSMERALKKSYPQADSVLPEMEEVLGALAGRPDIQVTPEKLNSAKEFFVELTTSLA